MSAGSFFDSAVTEHLRFANSRDISGLARAHVAAARAAAFALDAHEASPHMLYEATADDWCSIAEMYSRLTRIAMAHRRDNPGMEFHAANTAFAIMRERDSK